MGLGVPAFSNTQLNKAQDSRWLFMTISTGSIKMMFYDCNPIFAQPTSRITGGISQRSEFYCDNCQVRQEPPLSARNMALTFPQQWVHPWLLGDCRDWSIGHWFQSFSEATSIRWSTTDSFARRPSFFKRILIFLIHFGHNFGLSPFGHLLEDVTGPWLWNSLASSCLKLLAWSDKCNQCRFLSLTLRETSCSLSAWRSGWRAGPVERQQQQHAAVLCCQIAFIYIYICLYYLSIIYG